jgi:hypothetical protein
MNNNKPWNSSETSILKSMADAVSKPFSREFLSSLATMLQRTPEAIADKLEELDFKR